MGKGGWSWYFRKGGVGLHGTLLLLLLLLSGYSLVLEQHNILPGQTDFLWYCRYFWTTAPIIPYFLSWWLGLTNESPSISERASKSPILPLNNIFFGGGGRREGLTSCFSIHLREELKERTELSYNKYQNMYFHEGWALRHGKICLELWFPHPSHV